VQAPVAGGVSGEVLRGVRRAMAARMADAHSHVVPASVSDEVDIVAWREGTRPLPRLARAIAKACAAEPHLHVAYDDASGRVMACPKVHLGIAMETDEGLFVPVLRDVGQRTEAELTAAIATLKQAVRARGIAANDLRGQTITLSNYGAVGGRYATMVVVPPQVAIVGAGRIYERVVMVNGAAVAHAVLPLSLTFDHRVVTGVEACRFMATLIADLETST
jgi:pyruvate dehydrogenase E2 component (dihydrolipoamide acetyltransferase)